MANVIQELLISLGYKVDNKPLDDAEKGATDSAQRVESAWKKLGPAVGKALAGIGTALAGITAGATALTSKVINQGVEIDTWSKKLGTTAEELGRVEQAASGLNVPIDNTREAIKTLRENLGEMERLGTGPAVDSLKSLGLELEDVANLPIEQQLGVLSEAMRGVATDSQRLSIAIELMGEDGGALLPVLGLTSDEFSRMGDAAQNAGRVMSNDMVDTTLRLDRTLKEVRGAAGAVGLAIAEELLPDAEDIGEATRQWIKENEQLIKQDIPELVGDIAGGAKILAEAIAGLAEIFGPAGLTSALVGARVAMAAVGTSAAGVVPHIVAVTAAVTAGSAAINAFTDARIREMQAGSERLAAEVSTARKQFMKDIEGESLDELRQRRLELSHLRGTSAGGPIRDLDRLIRRKEEEMAAPVIADTQRTLGMAKADAARAEARRAARRGRGGRRRATPPAAMAEPSVEPPAHDPALDELLGTDMPMGVPSMRLSDASGGMEPQVLTQVNNITNNVEVNIPIDGAGDPRGVVDRLEERMSEFLVETFGESSRHQKVNFAR